MSFKFKRITAKLFSFFVKGLLLLAPVYITGYIIFSLLDSLDQHFYFHFRGTGLIIMVAIIMTVGFLGSTFISVPVVQIFEDALSHGIQKLGFITQTDLTFLSLQDSVMVYCPHSYAFSGEMLIVPASNVTLLNIPASDVMKMIISGGVSLSNV
jgi:uncharacterized membrane protein